MRIRARSPQDTTPDRTADEGRDRAGALRSRGLELLLARYWRAAAKRAFDAMMTMRKTGVAAIESARCGPGWRSAEPAAAQQIRQCDQGDGYQE